VKIALFMPITSGRMQTTLGQTNPKDFDSFSTLGHPKYIKNGVL
jgi:hypothetical protein